MQLLLSHIIHLWVGIHNQFLYYNKQNKENKLTPRVFILDIDILFHVQFTIYYFNFIF